MTFSSISSTVGGFRRRTDIRTGVTGEAGRAQRLELERLVFENEFHDLRPFRHAWRGARVGSPAPRLSGATKIWASIKRMMKAHRIMSFK
jgi:hypothetical protein